MSFSLHPRLAQDTIEIARLGLSSLRLMNDARFPWLLLVPVREEVREIYELSPADRGLLVEEIAHAAQALAAIHPHAKINVGALGNLVPQLHVHVVARFDTDPAWPGPVWGAGTPVPYGEAHLRETLDRLARQLAP